MPVLHRRGQAQQYADSVEAVSPFLAALTTELKRFNATNYGIRLKACQEIGHIVYHGGDIVAEYIVHDPRCITTLLALFPTESAAATSADGHSQQQQQQPHSPQHSTPHLSIAGQMHQQLHNLQTRVGSGAAVADPAATPSPTTGDTTAPDRPRRPSIPGSASPTSPEKPQQPISILVAGIKTLSILVRSNVAVLEVLEANGVFDILVNLLTHENEQLRVWSAHAMYFLLIKRFDVHGKRLVQASLQDALRQVTQDSEWSHFQYNDAEEILKLADLPYDPEKATAPKQFQLYAAQEGATTETAAGAATAPAAAEARSADSSASSNVSSGANAQSAALDGPLPQRSKFPMMYPGGCTGPRMKRVEVHDLSAEAFQELVTILQSLYKTGQMDALIQMHIDNVKAIHQTPKFLPMHRLMTRMVEMMVMSQATLLTGLPYWDSSWQASNPARAFVFRDNHFGTAKPTSKDQSLTGTFSGVEWRSAFVTRKGNDTITLDTPPFLYRMAAEFDTFANYSTMVETGIHGQVHNFVGGNMGSISEGPADPLFWMHHGAIDYFWAKWQGMTKVVNGVNVTNYNKYDGVDQGKPVSPNDTMQLLGTTYNVSSIVDYWNNFCYEYQDPINAPKGITPFPAQGVIDNANPANTETNANLSGGGINGTWAMPTEVSDEFLKRWGITREQYGKWRFLAGNILDAMNNQQRKTGQPPPTFAAPGRAALKGPTTSGNNPNAAGKIGARLSLLMLSVTYALLCLSCPLLGL
ncbi:hypothetical protein RI367_002534 [Sorochytrium milnesiophthora]